MDHVAREEVALTFAELQCVHLVFVVFHRRLTSIFGVFFSGDFSSARVPAEAEADDESLRHTSRTDMWNRVTRGADERHLNTISPL